MLSKYSWANKSELLKQYHDCEWGKPVHSDQKLFEMLILECMSCGLSWEIILKKRDYMRKVFDNFNPEILVKYDNEKIESLMRDPGIIRSRLKINAVIENAKAYLQITQKRTFNNFLWEYVNYEPILPKTTELITRNDISDRLSKDLKLLGFKFVGSVIIYSFMQAVGMIKEHDTNCPAK